MLAATDHEVPRRRLVPLLTISCVAAFTIANLTAWFAPQVVQGSMERFHLSATQAGLLPTCETLTSGLMSIVFASVLRRIDFRLYGLGALAVWAAANVASFYAASFSGLLVLRLVAGLANAILFYISTSLAAATRKPDQTYAFSNVASNLASASSLMIWPLLAPTASALSYLPFAVAYGVFALPFIAALPRRPVVDETVSPDGDPVDRAASGGTLRVLILSLALSLFTIQGFADFTFSFGIGLRLGLSEAEINNALGIATFVSMLGALSAGFAAGRFGRYGPQLLVFALFLISNYIEVTTGNTLLFRLALIVNLTALSFVLPFSLGWAAEIDPTGRGGSLMLGIFIIANALAPVLAGKLVDVATLGALAPSALVMLSAAIVLIGILRLQSPKPGIVRA